MLQRLYATDLFPRVNEQQNTSVHTASLTHDQLSGPYKIKLVEVPLKVFWSSHWISSLRRTFRYVFFFVRLVHTE